MATTFTFGDNSGAFYDNLHELLTSPAADILPTQRADLQTLAYKTPAEIESGDFVTPAGFGKVALYVLMAMTTMGATGRAIVLVPDCAMTYSNIRRLSTMPQVKDVSINKGVVTLNERIMVVPYNSLDMALSKFGIKDLSVIIAGNVHNNAGKNRRTSLLELSKTVPVFGLNAPAKYNDSIQDRYLTAYMASQKYIVGNSGKVRTAMLEIRRLQNTENKYRQVKFAEIVQKHQSHLYLYDSPENINAFIYAANRRGFKLKRRLDALSEFNLDDKGNEWINADKVTEKYIQGTVHQNLCRMREIYAVQKKGKKYQDIKMAYRRCGNTPSLCLYDSPENIAAFIGALRARGEVVGVRAELAQKPQKTAQWISIADVVSKYIEGSQDKLRAPISKIMADPKRFPDVKIQEMVNDHQSTGVYIFDSPENIAALVAAACALGHNISLRDNSIPTKTDDWAAALQVSKTIVGHKERIIAAMRAIYDAQQNANNPRFADVELQNMRSRSNIALCLHMTDENIQRFLVAALALNYKFNLRNQPKTYSFARGRAAVSAASAAADAQASHTADNQKQH